MQSSGTHVETLCQRLIDLASSTKGTRKRIEIPVFQCIVCPRNHLHRTWQLAATPAIPIQSPVHDLTLRRRDSFQETEQQSIDLIGHFQRQEVRYVWEKV